MHSFSFESPLLCQQTDITKTGSAFLLPYFRKDGDTMANNDKTAQAFDMIEQGVKDVYSSDKFKNYLSCLSKFHNYSLNNTLLILYQNPNATHVAGYNAWKYNFNRQVNKGEKGLVILAPFPTKETRMVDKLDENGKIVLDSNGHRVQEEKEFDKLCFKTTTVFDISQTTGDPLPELISDLKGSNKESLAMIETIKSASKIPIEFKNKSEDSNLANGAKGYYSPTTDQIVVNKGLEDIHTAKTLIHEYAHSILHKQTDKDQSQREIEAESLAFVICDHFGLDTSEYSFGYIASYANNDPKELNEILNNIQSTVHEMIEQLEPIYKEKLIMLTKEDIEHENYKLFENIARPILTGDAIYMKYSTPHFMDLNIEMFDENRYVMAHNYVLNGDLMADPDVEFIVDKDKELLLPQTYQQDNLQFYEVADTPLKQNELNQFMNQWLKNIPEQKYKVNAIYTEKDEITNKKDIQKFCEQYGIEKMAPPISKGIER